MKVQLGRDGGTSDEVVEERHSVALTIVQARSMCSYDAVALVGAVVVRLSDEALGSGRGFDLWHFKWISCSYSWLAV